MTIYSQPSFYHFSEDSIILSKIACEREEVRKPRDILDICCGCGVVGFEILRGMTGIKELTGIELQYEYEKYFSKNAMEFEKTRKIQFIQQDIKTVEFSKQFDLIVCNPPYYSLGEGRENPIVETNMAMRWDNKNNTSLLKLFAKLLRSNANGYFCTRFQIEYWQDAAQDAQLNLKLKMIKQHGKTNFISVSLIE